MVRPPAASLATIRRPQGKSAVMSCLNILTSSGKMSFRSLARVKVSSETTAASKGPLMSDHASMIRKDRSDVLMGV